MGRDRPAHGRALPRRGGRGVPGGDPRPGALALLRRAEAPGHLERRWLAREVRAVRRAGRPWTGGAYCNTPVRLGGPRAAKPASAGWDSPGTQSAKADFA